MLLLCITGLPLIFHEEIDDLLHEQVKAAAVPERTPLVDLDRAVASGLAAAPKQVAHFLIWDPDDANSLLLSVGPSIDVNPTDNRIIRVDAHTGTFLDAPDVTGRFTYIILKLHTDMFAGLPGKLFLGLMGILFCAAIVGWPHRRWKSARRSSRRAVALRRCYGGRGERCRAANR